GAPSRNEHLAPLRRGEVGTAKPFRVRGLLTFMISSSLRLARDAPPARVPNAPRNRNSIANHNAALRAPRFWGARRPELPAALARPADGVGVVRAAGARRRVGRGGDGKPGGGGLARPARHPTPACP